MTTSPHTRSPERSRLMPEERGLEKEVYTRNGSKVGNWNVRTMNKLGKLHLLLEEIYHINLDILGISETRWRGECLFQLGEHTIIQNGSDTGQSGVAFIFSKSVTVSIISYNMVSEHIICVKLSTKPTQTNIIQVYAPTSANSEEDIENSS